MANANEQERRRHNRQVREDNKEYWLDFIDTKFSIRDLKKYGADVPVQILEIMDDIIATQNKGVPLSDFQKEALMKLEETFNDIHYDELRKPRFVFNNGRSYIKDMHVITPDGKPNLTELEIENVHENQSLETVLPLGDTTFDLIDLISETLAENAKLMKQLNRELQTKNPLIDSQDKRSKFDEFENRIMDLEEQANLTKSREISILLNEIFELYGHTKDSIFKPVGDRGTLTNLPIVNYGDSENEVRKPEAVDASTRRAQTYRLPKVLPRDIKLVQMLPKNITEKLINILAKAMEENSILHNELYKKQKIQRKFPTKLILLTLATAVVAAGLYGAANIFNSKNAQDNTQPSPNNVVSIEDVITDEENEKTNQGNVGNNQENLGSNQENESVLDNVTTGESATIQENIAFYPDWIKTYINSAQAQLDRMEAYCMVAEKNADDIFQSSVSGGGYYADILGSNYKNRSYKENLDIIKSKIDELNSDKAQSFIKMLMDKKSNVANNATSKTFEDYGLTQQEYEHYKSLYEYVSDLNYKLNKMENEIRQNKDLQTILDNQPVTITEKDVEKILVSAGLGALVGMTGAAAIALFLIHQNAKKKELEAQKLNAKNTNKDESGNSLG